MGTPAQQVQTDYLSARLPNELEASGQETNSAGRSGFSVNPVHFEGNRGVYFVLDMGREEAGFFEMEVEADEGTIIDIAHGEHLDDLRVRAYVGGRHFANRYICREGKQVFTHYFRRIGGRYIELHVLNGRSRFIMQYAGMRPAEYPVEQKGLFRCNDNLHQQICDVSRRTLELCMHEHYEDCPWREQALYAMDSRNQALCGYYCFGEYDFPEVSFSLLGNSIKADGTLELIAPSLFERTIPSFNLVWILEIWEHYLYSGRIDPVLAAMPAVWQILAACIGNLQGGLLATPMGSRYWNFYEWADGLDNFNDPVINDGSARFDAPLNLFFHIALRSAVQLAAAAGEREFVKEYTDCAVMVERQFHDKFWDASKQLYATYIGDAAKESHYSELTQALALYAGICPEQYATDLRAKLAGEDNGMVKATLSYSIYKYEALMGEADQYAGTVFDSITRDWGHMLYHGATSFWETIKGGDDFDKAGSLCHGWSAIPLYFYYAYLLGVKPVEPGFQTFTVTPVASALRGAYGRVPTPYGDIRVSASGTNDTVVEIYAPAGTQRV